MAAENKNILSFMAHPDDAEFLCAGTLARLKECGYEIHIATMTAGDGGSVELPNEEIARIRYREAEQAAIILGADYYCAHAQDFFVVFDRPHLQSAIEIIRRIDPFLVITHSPQDYLIDHEMTSSIVRAACFAAPAPNARTHRDEAKSPTAKIPYLYYADAVEGIDIFGKAIKPDFYIDITDVIDTKIQMLACHESQRAWLLKQHGIDHYINSMTTWASLRGNDFGVPYAESFRQHLGHAYPKDNKLVEILS